MLNKDIVYLKIPKNGSSTIREVFKPYSNLFFYNSHDEFEQDIEPDRENIIKFTTVRNPYTRAISSWQHCLKEKWIKNISLIDFLNLDFNINNNISVYSMTQCDYIDLFLKNDLDFVLKLENLNEDLSRFLPNLNFKGNVENKGKYKPYTLTQKECKIIEKIFKIDFEYFKYLNEPNL